MRLVLFLFLVGLLLGASARGADLINTDRPSFTNSTVLILPGSLQLESGFSRQKSQDPDGTQTWTSQTPLLLRAGISPSVEVRLNWNGYAWQRVDVTRSEGAGDLSAGFKWRHREKNGAWPAVASVVMLGAPTGASRVRTPGVRPGWQLPLDWDLPAECSLTLMPATTYERSDEGRHFWSGSFGATVEHGWTSNVQTFMEWAGQQFAAPLDGGTIMTFDTGVTWQIRPDWQIDGALWYGLNRNSPALFWTLGLSTRGLGLWHRGRI